MHVSRYLYYQVSGSYINVLVICKTWFGLFINPSYDEPLYKVMFKLSLRWNVGCKLYYSKLMIPTVVWGSMLTL